MISDTSDSCTMTVPWQYHDSTWQTFPVPSWSVGDYRTQTPVSRIEVFYYICNWLLLLLLLLGGDFFYTKKINLMKPIYEVKCHIFCIWMIICLFNYGINYEYWLFKISKILKLIFYFPYSMSASSGLPPH